MQVYKTKTWFGRDIWNDIINPHDALEEQTNLKNEINKFDDLSREKAQNKEEDKPLTNEYANKLHERRHKVCNIFESKIFQIRTSIKGARIKLLKPTQMLQRLPIVHWQLNSGNALQNLLNEN